MRGIAGARIAGARDNLDVQFECVLTPGDATRVIPTRRGAKGLSKNGTLPPHRRSGSDAPVWDRERTYRSVFEGALQNVNEASLRSREVFPRTSKGLLLPSVLFTALPTSHAARRGTDEARPGLRSARAPPSSARHASEGHPKANGSGREGRNHCLRQGRSIPGEEAPRRLRGN